MSSHQSYSQSQLEELKSRKKVIEGRVNEFRPELNDALAQAGSNRMRSRKAAITVSRVQRKQHRRPSLKDTYQAILNVLGKDAEERVRSEIGRRREIHGEYESSRRKLRVIPLNQLRKTRKDKKPASQGPASTERKKKLKFTRRKRTKPA